MIKECKVGFWGDEPHEQPIHYPLDWGVDKVLQGLEEKEEEAQVRKFKGHAKCRICGKSIGSKEYKLDDATQPVIWVWPEGLKHYIKVHHIVPDYRFWCYLTNKKPAPTYSYKKPEKKRFFFVLRGKTYGSR